MPRYTSAYSELLTNIKEVETLYKLAFSFSKKISDDNFSKIDALSRGAIVLLSSRLEAYIKSLGELGIDRLTDASIKISKIDYRIQYHSTKSIVKLISQANDIEKTSKLIKNFATDYSDIWIPENTLTKSMINNSFQEGFSVPLFINIKSYLARFGFENFEHNMRTVLTRDFNHIVSQMDLLVKTRNSIAHGDPIVSKTPSEIKEFIKQLKLYCRTIDTLFANWFKGRYCSLR